MPAAALFRPITIGTLTLPNRIVMAPMTRNFSPGNVPDENVAAYYRRRADKNLRIGQVLLYFFIHVEGPCHADHAQILSTARRGARRRP